jgi:hypothetical protein
MISIPTIASPVSAVCFVKFKICMNRDKDISQLTPLSMNSIS